MENIRRKYNPIIDLSKFTSNKKKFNGIVAISYNQVYGKTLSKLNLN